MCLLQEVPTVLKCLFRLTGIIQFSSTIQSSFLSKILSRFWCIPFYSYIIYLSVYFNMYVLDERTTDISLSAHKIKNCGNIAYLLISVVCFYRRSNNIKLLLLKLNKNRYHSFINNSLKCRNWLGIILFVVLSLTFVCAPFLDIGLNYLIYDMFPLTLSSLDILFLTEIMNTAFSKFKQLNCIMQRQVSSPDFFNLFHLSKGARIQDLDENEITFNIQRIQELSHFHSDLVDTANEICQNFEITIIVELVGWFENIIIIIYTGISLIVNKENRYPSEYAICIIFTFYLFCWLFVLIESFTRVQNQADLTAFYIHDVWNKYAGDGKIDRRIRHLQLISMRLQINKINFTARNFFKLDWHSCHMVNVCYCENVISLCYF
jgi:hypothetical protein